MKKLNTNVYYKLLSPREHVQFTFLVHVPKYLFLVVFAM